MIVAWNRREAPVPCHNHRSGERRRRERAGGGAGNQAHSTNCRAVYANPCYVVLLWITCSGAMIYLKLIFIPT